MFPGVLVTPVNSLKVSKIKKKNEANYPEIMIFRLAIASSKIHCWEHLKRALVLNKV